MSALRVDVLVVVADGRLAGARLGDRLLLASAEVHELSSEHFDGGCWDLFWWEKCSKFESVVIV